MFSRNLCGIACAVASRSPLTCSGRDDRQLDRGPEGVVDLGGDAHGVIVALRPPISLRRPLEEPPLRPVLGERERPEVGVARLLGAAEAPQEVGSGRVVVPVLVEPLDARRSARSPRSTSPASATATAWLSRATGEPSSRSSAS